MNSKPFLIIGLPRSRTAWLANYFTFGGRVCYHEKVYSSVEELVSQLGDKDGSSDSSLCLDWKDVLALAPQVKILIVVRKFEDCVESLAQKVNYSLANIVIKNCDRGLGHLSLGLPQEAEALFIKYQHIDVRLPEIQNFLTPEIPYSKERHEMLMGLNITQDFTKAAIKHGS